MRFERAASARSGSSRGWAVMVVVAFVALGCGKTANSGSAADAGGQKPGECNPPKLVCNGKCVSLEDDARNCGKCGGQCPADNGCSGGTCVVTKCPGGEVMCGGLCVDTQTNRLNCNECNVACNPGESCVAGACICDPATHAMCNGTCEDLASSSGNCGACGNACGSNEMCSQGACVSRCPSGVAYCDGACVDISRDLKSCGGCNVACKGAEACVQGKCTCPDDAQHAVCNGTCVDLFEDGANCGTCGNVCPAGNHCIASAGITSQTGACTPCNPGYEFFFCPPAVGDPLATCRAQAATVRAQGDAAGSDALLCQCNHCLTELTDCAGDLGCVAGWQCAVQKACTEPCWDTMGVCSMSSATVGTCWKFCPPSTGTPQSMTRAEALFRCSQANGCGIRP